MDNDMSEAPASVKDNCPIHGLYVMDENTNTCIECRNESVDRILEPIEGFRQIIQGMLGVIDLEYEQRKIEVGICRNSLINPDDPNEVWLIVRDKFDDGSDDPSTAYMTPAEARQVAAVLTKFADDAETKQ